MRWRELKLLSKETFPNSLCSLILVREGFDSCTLRKTQNSKLKTHDNRRRLRRGPHARARHHYRARIHPLPFPQASDRPPGADKHGGFHGAAAAAVAFRDDTPRARLPGGPALRKGASAGPA